MSTFAEIVCAALKVAELELDQSQESIRDAAELIASQVALKGGASALQLLYRLSEKIAQQGWNADVVDRVSLLEESVEDCIATNKQEDNNSRKLLAIAINGLIKRANATLIHPEDGTECIFVAISDQWGGKFALSERGTNKRSRTKRRIEDLFPLQVAFQGTMRPSGTIKVFGSSEIDPKEITKRSSSDTEEAE